MVVIQGQKSFLFMVNIQSFFSIYSKHSGLKECLKHFNTLLPDELLLGEHGETRAEARHCPGEGDIFQKKSKIGV